MTSWSAARATIRSSAVAGPTCSWATAIAAPATQSAKTGRDKLYGGQGNEVIVGDNLAGGDAAGGKPDRLGGNIGAETIIGDSAVTGSGTASGGADDWVAAMQGDDLVIGDSFSPRGVANGGGDDVLNHALDDVLMIGDSATLAGTASGGGNDKLHGATGGDYYEKCRGCDNRLYGDSYALTSDGADLGKGNDLLTAGLGDNTYLDGQGSNPGGGGRGKTLCAGNSDGHNVAAALCRLPAHSARAELSGAAPTEVATEALRRLVADSGSGSPRP